jgi:8-oxo-dGTP diphosphatase
MRKTTSSLIIHNNKILLLLRDNKPEIPDPDKWQTIGGQVEQYESFDDAIKREIKEETNLTPSDIKYYGKLNGKDFTLAFYVAHLTDEEASSVRLGNEGQALEFFTLDEMKNLDLSFSIRVYFEKYLPQLDKLVRGEGVPIKELGLVL